jgi:uncharacterized DUF497 family protein
MRFEWDEKKNKSNIIKHGISFEEAIDVFEDPFHLAVVVNEGELICQSQSRKKITLR